MNSPWFARFAGAPALVAPERRANFESSLIALAADPAAAQLAASRAGSNNQFWTELGDALTKRVRPYIVQNGMLLVPVKGVLLHDFPYQVYNYATGYEYIWEAVKRGLDDAAVKGIAFVIDSPGGEAAGNFDLVDRIYGRRGEKPIRAFAAEVAYSGAYSIASVADTITVSRTGGVGSIGVVTSHLDISKAYAEIGFKVTFIFAGKHKVDGNAYEPLPKEVRDRIQSRVDDLYGVFVATVARNRGLSEQAVRATEALTFSASESVANGLADAICALDTSLAAFAADLANPPSQDSPTDPEPDVSGPAPADRGQSYGSKHMSKSAEQQWQDDPALQAEFPSAGAYAAHKRDEERRGAPYRPVGSTTDATKNGGVPMRSSIGLFGNRSSQAAAVDKGPAAGSPPAQEGRWRAEYASSAALQAEFISADTYVALRRWEARRRR